MPVTLEIAGRAVSRLGNAAVSVPVVVRNAQTLAVAWSGATDNNGFFTSALLEDANEYRAEVEYDTTNHFKTLRDLASGQMNMLQVRKRFHVRGAATPCIIDGAMSVGGMLNAANIQIGGQLLDDRFYNVGETVANASAAANASALGGQPPAFYAPTTHTHPDPPELYHALIATTSYVGNGAFSAGGRPVYTAPVGWTIMAAIIHEQTATQSVLIATRASSGPIQANSATGMYGNAGPGGDEVIGGNKVLFTGLPPNGIVVGVGTTAADAGLGMNFNGSPYNVIVFLGKQGN
jgi:hypothetical protein